MKSVVAAVSSILIVSLRAAVAHAHRAMQVVVLVRTGVIGRWAFGQEPATPIGQIHREEHPITGA